MSAYQGIVDRVMEFDRSLKADEPRFSGGVLVIHDEGVLIQDSAFAVLLEDDQFLIVYGEHIVPRIFEMESVTKWSNLEFEYPPRKESDDNP